MTLVKLLRHVAQHFQDLQYNFNSHLVASRYAKQFGALRLSIGEALRHVVAKQPKSSLAKCIVSHLNTGAVVPDELAVDVLYTMLLDTSCATKG